MKIKLTNEYCSELVEQKHKCKKLGNNWIQRINGYVYLDYECEHGHKNIGRRIDQIKNKDCICSICIKENKKNKDINIISQEFVIDFLKKHNCKPNGINWFIKDNGKTSLEFICLNGHKSTRRYDMIKDKKNICEHCVNNENSIILFDELYIKVNEKGYKLLQIEEGDKELTRKKIDIECKKCFEKRNIHISIFYREELPCQNCIFIDKKNNPCCIDCKEYLPSEFFSKDSLSLSGLNSTCRECEQYKQCVRYDKHHLIIEKFRECINCNCFKKLERYTNENKVCNFCLNEPIKQNLMKELLVELRRYLLILEVNKKEKEKIELEEKLKTQKFCVIHQIWEPIENFSRNKKLKDGLNNYCKKGKELYKKMEEKPIIDRKTKELKKEKIIIDKTHLCPQCKEEKSYNDFNFNEETLTISTKTKCNECVRQNRIERRSQEQEKIKINLRSRMYKAMKGRTKSDSTLNLIGCDIDFLWNYLESKFTEEMTRENYGEYWSIDHIIPCESFDFENEIEQQICFNYRNLQPLKCSENSSKQHYYDPKEKEKYVNEMMEILQNNNNSLKP